MSEYPKCSEPALHFPLAKELWVCSEHKSGSLTGEMPGDSYLPVTTSPADERATPFPQMFSDGWESYETDLTDFKNTGVALHNIAKAIQIGMIIRISSVYVLDGKPHLFVLLTNRLPHER